jgi:chromosome partitioning protein
MAAVTIAVLNMKGGVGKTTLSVNLAWHMCRRGGKRSLLVDLDPQFNASQYLMGFETYNAQRRKGTIADILIEPQRPRMTASPKRVKKTKKGAAAIRKYIYNVETGIGDAKFDLIPSELALAKVVKNPQGADYKLKRALEPVLDEYDYIVIDCAPTDSVLTTTALMASDFVLIPVKPDRFSVLGYGQILEALDDFRANYPDPHSVQDLGVVFTQLQGGNSIETECMAEVEKQADYIFDAKIWRSNTYLRSVHEQTPVFDTRNARKLTATSIAALTKELEARIKELKDG